MIFKKKKQIKPFTPGQIKLPKKNSSKRIKRNRLFTLSTGKKNLATLILVPIIGISVFILIIALVQLVLKIREKPSVNLDDYTEDRVIGFEDVPAYPYSEFVFQNKTEELAVQEFIGKGYSIYRISPSKTFKDATQYYKENMEKFGWTFVQEVPPESTDKKYGFYWQKESEGIGIRLYDQINDIWYQKITDEQARNGLSDIVNYEKEIAQIIEDAKKVSLLPNYPWQLQIDRDYVATYYIIDSAETVISEIFGVSFKTKGESGRIDLFPVMIYTGGTIDKYIDDVELSRGYKIDNHSYKQLSIGTVLEAQVQPNTTTNSSGQSNTESETQLSQIPNSVTILIQYNKKVVFLIERYGNNEAISNMYDYIISNIR